MGPDRLVKIGRRLRGLAQKLAWNVSSDWGILLRIAIVDAPTFDPATRVFSEL